jgi:hypothetical protein
VGGVTYDAGMERRSYLRRRDEEAVLPHGAGMEEALLLAAQGQRGALTCGAGMGRIRPLSQRHTGPFEGPSYKIEALSCEV